MVHTLYTIGHSNRTPDDLIAHLRQHQITLLVDVRSAPYSRYVPHFNKKSLHALLHEHDIKYSFAGEKLGGRPQNPDSYHSNDVPDDDTERAKFLKLVDYATKRLSCCHPAFAGNHA